MKSILIVIVALLIYYLLVTGFVKFLATKRQNIISRNVDKIDKEISNMK